MIAILFTCVLREVVIICLSNILTCIGNIAGQKFWQIRLMMLNLPKKFPSMLINVRNEGLSSDLSKLRPSKIFSRTVCLVKFAGTWR